MNGAKDSSRSENELYHSMCMSKELGTLIRGETVIYPCYQLNSSHSHCVTVFYIHSVSSSARLNFEVVSHLIHL